MFKKMYVQKRKEMIKEYEKQEKRIKELKAHGQSKKAAVSYWVYATKLKIKFIHKNVNLNGACYLKHKFTSIFVSISFIQEKKQKEALTRKQEKNKGKVQKNEEEDGPQELLSRPKEYIVKFRFPEPSQLQPPILGLHSMKLLLFILIIRLINISYRCYVQFPRPKAAIYWLRVWYWFE